MAALSFRLLLSWHPANSKTLLGAAGAAGAVSRQGCPFSTAMHFNANS